MARNRFDLHNTARKDDELTDEQMEKIADWWGRQALPLMGEVGMSKTPIVMIVSVGDIPEIDIDELGSKVKWVTMPQETYDQIVRLLEHPETGVRQGRPKRKEDGDNVVEQEPERSL